MEPLTVGGPTSRGVRHAQLAYQRLDASGVVQEYIAHPYLKLSQRKFDFRLYVLIESLDPLRVYMCDEGLTRFCTVPYRAPRRQNMDNVQMHLTNYSVNKGSVGYIHTSILDPDPTSVSSDGTKRTLTTVLAQIFLGS